MNSRVKLVALIFCTQEFASLSIILGANWPYSIFARIVPKISRPHLFPSTFFQFVIHGASYFATVASLQLYPDIYTYTITLHKGRYCFVNLLCRILLGKRVIFCWSVYRSICFCTSTEGTSVPFSWVCYYLCNVRIWTSV